MIAASHDRSGKCVRRGELGVSISVLLFSFLFLVVAFAPGQTSPPTASKTVQSGTAPATGTPYPEVSKYVGTETCKTCHEEIYNVWEKTPHWKTTLNEK